MLITSFQPQACLREIVREYRVVHFDLGNTVSCKPYAPRAEQCLNFYPRSLERVDDQSGNTISKGVAVALIGQQTGMTHRHVHGDFLVITVVFRQGALFRLTGVPAHELTGLYIDADHVFNKNIRFVNEQLYSARTYGRCIDVIEQFLRSQLTCLKVSSRIDLCADSMLVDHATSLDARADFSCLSIRQFRRGFTERIGVTPKLLAKIVRFEKACQSKIRNPDRDMLEVAVACGFTDYQHMAKDYRNFTGQTPIGFHELDQRAPERQQGKYCT